MAGLEFKILDILRFFKVFFSIIESLILDQQELFMTDYLLAISSKRIQDPEWVWRSKYRTSLKCFSIFLTFADILPSM